MTWTFYANRYAVRGRAFHPQTRERVCILLDHYSCCCSPVLVTLVAATLSPPFVCPRHSATSNAADALLLSISKLSLIVPVKACFLHHQQQKLKTPSPKEKETLNPNKVASYIFHESKLTIFYCNVLNFLSKSTILSFTERNSLTKRKFIRLVS